MNAILGLLITEIVNIVLNIYYERDPTATKSWLLKRVEFELKAHGNAIKYV